MDHDGRRAKPEPFAAADRPIRCAPRFPGGPAQSGAAARRPVGGSAAFRNSAGAGSGSGQHAVFSRMRSHRCFGCRPTRGRRRAPASSPGQRRRRSNRPGPRAINVTDAEWDIVPGDDISAMVSANMIHIARGRRASGCSPGPAATSRREGRCLYGPFRRDGRHIAGQRSLRPRPARAGCAVGHPRSGGGDGCAEAAGLIFDEAREMPANNLTVIYRKPRPPR